MSLDPTKVSRFGGTRARTGCLTCVRSHVKCDERKPACSRCIRIGRLCEQRQNVRSGSSLRVVYYTSNPFPRLDLSASIDPRESRCFDYFRIRTITELSTLCGGEHWPTHTLQIAKKESSIWHAAVALGAVHEHFERMSPESSDSRGLSFALTQYSKAIKALLDSIQTSSFFSEDTPLLACVLFCAFESLSYHLHSALSHISGGLKLISECQDRATSIIDSRRCLAMLMPVFIRLDTQRLHLGDSAFSSSGFWLFSATSTQNIRSIHDAKVSFDYILNDLLRKVKAFGNWKGERDDLEETLRTYCVWSSAVDRIIYSNDALVDMPSMLVLQLWRLLVVLMLLIDLRLGEMAFDNFTTEFHMMVSLVECFLSLSYPAFRVPPVKSMARTQRTMEQRPLLRHTARTYAGDLRSGFLGIHPLHSPLAKSTPLMRGLAHQSSSCLLRHAGHFHEHADERSSDPEPSPLKPVFSLSHGIIYPLYVVITRCRDFNIRWRAWQLIDMCKRREGLWDSELAASLGLRIIQIEHAHELQLVSSHPQVPQSLDRRISKDLSQIPNDARIRTVKPTFLANRRSIERYYFGWSEGSKATDIVDEVWLEEVLEW